MRWLLTSLVVIVVLLHQDFWLWTDRSLVFGFLPVGLAYHLGYAILASLTMALLVRYAWPRQLERTTPLSTPEGAAANEARL